MIPEKYLIKSSVKYPTSIVVSGTSKLGLEIAESLLEQGIYVIIIDTDTPENLAKLDTLPKGGLLSFVDYSNITYLEDEIRRLDYVFFLAHDTKDPESSISSQEFLTFSNYLDMTLALALRFEAKFLLSTSIKAHQWALNNELHFHLAKDLIQNTTYTSSEIQRYAESLCIEYFNKRKLDVRIVRLAELIGEGIDFLSKSNFNDILLQAVQNNCIRLKKDGLESEFLVHVLDAAYGLIKAQFSQNTMGKIFTLAYEHPFTHLSIAYKIQDINPDVKEIIFEKEDDNLPSIKIYKPAPNLSTIGWLPRISIERAIKQSMADAKLFLLSLDPKKDDERLQSTKSKKIKKFLNFAKGLPINQLEEDSSSNTLSKLLSEKLKQEQIKAAELSLASERVKQARKFRQLTFEEKLRSFVWQVSLYLGKNFSIFKHKSPAQIAFITGLVFTLSLMYFFVISPLILTAKISFINYSLLDEIVTNSNDVNSLELNLEKFIDSAKELQFVLGQTGWIFQLIGLKDQYESFMNFNEKLNEIVFDFSKLVKPVNLFVTSLKSQRNNISLTLASDSYLSINATGIGIKEYLDQIENDSQNVSIYHSSIQKNLKELKSISYQVPVIGEFLFNSFNKINSIYDQSIKNFNLSLVSELLGNNREQTHLIILADNLRPKPMGGDVAGLILVTFNNGAITSIVAKPISEVNFDFSFIGSKEIDTINLTKFTQVDKQTFSFSDIMYDITDNFFDTTAKIISTVYNKKINNIFVINLSSLIEVSKNLEIEVDVDNTLIRGAEDIVKSQDANFSLKSRHKSITVYGSKVLYYLYDSLLKGNLGVLANIDGLLRSRDIQLLGSNKIKSYFDISSYENLIKYDTFLNVYLGVEDSLYNSPTKLPVLSHAYSAEVTKNLSETAKLLLRLPNLGISSELSLCMNANISNSNIKILDFPNIKTSINEFQNIKCIVFKITNENQITIEYNKNLTDTNASDYDIFIKKSPGIVHNIDISLKIFPSNQNFRINRQMVEGNKYMYSGLMFSDKILNLEYR